MRENGTWSIGLGHWGGIPFRLHALFLLFAVATLYVAQMAVRAGADLPDHSLMWLAVTSLVVLYLSVLVHELAHWTLARYLGGGADEIVLGPLGGLAPFRPMDDPRLELAIYTAGPLANLLVCGLICFPVMAAQGQAQAVLGLLNPLAPEGISAHVAIGWDALAPLAFWINWCLFLINLIPADPFDGGPMLRAGLRSWRPELGRKPIGLLVARLAKAGAFGLLVAAWLVREQTTYGPFPPWFALVLLAGCVFFAARQQERRAMAEADEETWVPTNLWTERPRKDVGSLELASSAQERLMREVEARRTARPIWESERDDGDEERRVDEVLARLHEVGLDQLTVEERQILERASARYRNRR